MENQYALMMAGFLNALTPTNLIVMLLSVTMGIIIGCMPGLSAAMGVALLLPLTFGMEPSSGLIMLGGIYCGHFWRLNFCYFDSHPRNPSFCCNGH